jgi:membrane-bound lytic murein transglycosylase MltF
MILLLLLGWTGAAWAQASGPPMLEDPAAVEDPGDPLLEAALRPWAGDLDGMIERGSIRVGIPYGLATYFLDGPHHRGPTYDLVMEFEKGVKKRLGAAATNLTVVVVPVRRDRIVDMLTDGLIDIGAGTLTVTPERQARVDFSEPFYRDVREILVTGPAAPAVTNADDLVGSAIHVRRSSSFFEHLTAFNARRVAAGKPPVPVIAADENLATEDLLEMAEAGLIPATIADEPVARMLAQLFPDITLRTDMVLAEGQTIAWAFRKRSPKLAAEVNAFADRARKGTALGNIVVGKYSQGSEWLQNALAPEDRARFEAIVGYLRTYADRYGFDWLMIGAQGYQESRLDQRKRSHVGAIGVMQVMPATAQDPNVGIPDIHEVENNIHAGVKYLRFLRSRYFSDPAVDELNQTLFTFAAYNAGPGNVIKARKRAARMGLDPDVWLDNVEIAAARVVSREPVVYVRNIYRYYVAYKLILAGRTAM